MPSRQPRRLVWADGRRYRASAAGRQPGHRHVQARRLPALASGTLALAVTAATFVASSGLWVAYAASLPDARTIALATLPQDSIIYDSSGQVVLADLHSQGYRHYEQPLSQMGSLLPEATIAIEDANFYHEPGIDLAAMVRAAWVDYQAGAPVEGASTITQQLVKLRLLTDEKTIQRKAEEALLALEVEHDFSKQQILEMYLNTVFYGNDAYGTEAAAQSYFHTETAKLDLAQASMLAGIPEDPTYLSPLLNFPAAKARQRDVLDAMVRQGYVTSLHAEQAFAEDISPPAHMFEDTTAVLAPAFVNYVTSELKGRFGAAAPDSAGLHVTTTLNWSMEQTAQQMISAQVARYQGWGANVQQGAMVAIDPKTGGILAMIGSANPDTQGGQYNFAVWPPRNPGSSMKIFNYTAAIASRRFTMVTPVADAPISFPSGPSLPPYRPRNYDGRFHGTCQLQACFLNSLNVPAVKVEAAQGVSPVVTTARAMGAPPWTYHTSSGTYTSDDPVGSYGLSLTLGGYGETPLQMATGASVLADGGVLRDIHSVLAVTASDGAPMYRANPTDGATQAVDARVAFIMDQIMSDDSNRAMIFGYHSNLTLPDRRVAAKTGTTDNYKDGWTVGFTPDVASAFWFGNPDWTPMPVGAEASLVAAPVWHSFMQWATDVALHEPGSDWFTEPAGLDHYYVNGKLQWFLPGTSPATVPPSLPSGQPLSSR